MCAYIVYYFVVGRNLESFYENAFDGRLTFHTKQLSWKVQAKLDVIKGETPLYMYCKIIYFIKL